jgi:H+/Cl- antiporter ClcA
MAGTMIVKFGMLLAGALFIFAAVKPTFVGGTLDVTLFVIGVACALVGLVLLRKPGGPQGSAGA